MSCPDRPSIDMLAYDVTIVYKENNKPLIKTFKANSTLERIVIYNRSVGCIDYLVFRWANAVPWIMEKKKVERIEVNGKAMNI